jgi:hypothetical protein
MDWPASMLSDIEAGVQIIQPLDLELILALYGVDDQHEIADLVVLAHVARTSTWWARHGLTGAHQHYVSCEAEASRISIYQPLVVPGLLQTRAYALSATAAILGGQPDSADVVARVKIRAERQRMVADRVAAGARPEIIAIMEEAVLHRPVGGPDILREQLTHLLTQAEQTHVKLVVMPTDQGGHVGLGGVFELLEFEDERDLDLLFIESAASDYLHRGPELTALYRAKVDSLQRAGLTGDSALRCIQDVRDSLSG